jgi:AcrR family transcriptional regulator
VSLREIRIAAGQRNSSALQFHFANREGLLLALVDRHMPRIFALQEELYAELVATGRQDEFASLVEVMVRPTAEYVRRGPSARAWVRISAERLARPETGPAQMAGHVHPVGIEVGTRVHRHLTTFLDDDVALDRLLSVLVAAHHLCADRSRVEEAPPHETGRERLPFDRWLTNLVDMAIGALSVAPGGGREGQPRT